MEALVISDSYLKPEFFSALAEKPTLCPSLNTIAFRNCEVTSDVVDELKRISAERANTTAARLHRIVIINHTRNLPDCELVWELQEFVPRVDVAMGEELPDLL